jgi:lipopolysaccharide O-acetyltransferase
MDGATAEPSNQRTGRKVVARWPRPNILWRLVRHAWRTTDAIFLRARFASFGKGSFVQRPRTIFGAERVALGNRVQIWWGSRIDAVPGGGDGPVVTIGDGTEIQPNVHIAAAEGVVIGHHVLIASGVYITDHDHDISDPDNDVVHNHTLVTSPVRIGDFVWLGERAMVLKGVSVGDHSVIGAGSVVTRDVPAYAIAAGVPARVIRQFDRETRTWRPVGGGR